MEDEEHVLFHCPEYDVRHQEYPELLLCTNKNIKNISVFDNQETIVQHLWNIIMIRIKLGSAVFLPFSVVSAVFLLFSVGQGLGWFRP